MLRSRRHPRDSWHLVTYPSPIAHPGAPRCPVGQTIVPSSLPPLQSPNPTARCPVPATFQLGAGIGASAHWLAITRVPPRKIKTRQIFDRTLRGALKLEEARRIMVHRIQCGLVHGIQYTGSMQRPRNLLYSLLRKLITAHGCAYISRRRTHLQNDDADGHFQVGHPAP